MKRARFIWFFVFLMIAGGALPALAGTITEYHTPSADSSPAALAFAPDGTLWFTEINANKIGKLVPSEVVAGTTKGITEYDLPQPNSKPHYITVAKDGMVWFTQMSGNRIGRLDPATGAIKEYPIPTADSEPHQIKEGADGSLWFLEFETNKVARLDPATGVIREYPIGEGHPHAMALAGDKIWYTQGGKFWMQAFANKVGVLDMATGKFEEVTVPPVKSVPHGMTRAGDGTIWFTQLFASKLARLDPSESHPQKVLEYPLGQRKGPHDVVVDDQRGWVWFTANRPDSIGRLDLAQAQPGTPQGVEFFKIPTPHSHPSQLVLDKEGNVWFTEMGMYFRGKYENKIGKLVP